MAYNYITLSGLLTQLAERLDDSANIYWTQPELTAYLQEALRTFQALTGYWRASMQFQTNINTAFYDLTAQAGSAMPMSVTDAQILSVILYQLIEPQFSGAAWTPTDMFYSDDFTKAMERRRNQFLYETGMVTTIQNNVPAGTPPVKQVPIPDSVINVRRCAWLRPSGRPYGVGKYGYGPYNGGYGKLTNLWRSSEFGAQAFKQNWALQPAEIPTAYSVAAEPPLTLAMIPPALNPGQLQVLSVNSGAALNPTVGVPLGVPDNFSWVVKWGALSDLLSKAGQALDPARADYCEKRWQQGIELARNHTSVVYGSINGKDVLIDALESLDAFAPSWQNGIAPPTRIALASWNMLVAAPPPDQGPYQIQVDVLQNAMVLDLPNAATQKIQIGREELDALLAYSEHLAMFKQGGQEFLSTEPLVDRFFKVASVYNESLNADVDFFEPMSDKATREEILRPRRSVAAPVESDAA